MIPKTELPEQVARLQSELRKFEQQFTDYAGTREEIRELALQFGDWVWYVIGARLSAAVAFAELDKDSYAHGWSAMLTCQGWLYTHDGGTTD